MDVPSNTAVAAAAQATSKAGSQPSGARGSGASHSHAHSLLALTALGVVFGDIVTSPLYTFSVAVAAAVHAPGSVEVLGIVSLTFWALMALISVKYVTFVLRADNDGERGILALLSLVEHHHATSERAKLSIVLLLGVIGAALLYGDGVITPAISVLSAIEELKFSPCAATSVVAATTRQPGRTFCPSASRHLERRPLVRPGHGGVVRRHRRPWPHQHLGDAGDPRSIQSAPSSAVCDCKSDDAVHRARRRIPGLDRRRGAVRRHGHVGRPAIRQAWFGLVLPALVLCYFGQGALVLAYPKAIESPFYSFAPAWALIPLVVLAALSTIIASQALISGVFSMTRQAIQMGCAHPRR